MKTSKCLALTCCVLILPYLILAQHSVVNAIRVFNVQRGTSVNISCNYKKSVDTKIIVATLNLSQKLCFCNINKSQVYQSCYRDIRLIWVAETEEITFELSNLQINNSGTYTCTVERHVPPPVINLGTDQTTVQVVASPHVSVSCVKDTDGFPMVLCSSEGFYPSDLELVWLRDGQFLNVSQTHYTNRTNQDGSITLHSYLNVSSAMSDYLNYSCWVNHSSLNKPVVLHLGKAVLIKNRVSLLSDNMMIVLVISALLILIILIMAVVLKQRTNHRSPVSPETHSHPQLEQVYSMLGDHHPVPCSNRPN